MKRHFCVDFGIEAAKKRHKMSFHAGEVEIMMQTCTMSDAQKNLSGGTQNEKNKGKE